MTSLSSIAKATGLAVTTVSEILRNKPGYSEATRRKVQDAARKFSYRPNLAARQLRGSRSNVIGVLIGMDNPQANLDRAAALERVAYGRGYRLIIGQIHAADDRCAEYLNDFAARGVDGIFWLHQPFVGKSELPDKGMVENAHVVSLDHAVGPGAGVVRIDYAAGIEQAMAYLVRSGRKRIGLAIAGPGGKGDPLQARLAGYRRGLKEAGLADERVWVGDNAETPNAGHLQTVLRQLVKEQRADAILASNDIWAAELLRAARRAGINVPKDLAVVGFDNLMLASLCDPALTTVDQQHEAFATASVRMMEELLTGSGTPGEIVIQPKLVVRESA